MTIKNTAFYVFSFGMLVACLAFSNGGGAQFFTLSHLLHKIESKH